MAELRPPKAAEGTAEPKAPEGVAGTAPESLVQAGESEKGGTGSSLGGLAGVPDSAPKAEAVVQADIVIADSARSEAQVQQIAAAHRTETGNRFGGIRSGLTGFFARTAEGVRRVIAAKEAEITAASSRGLKSVQAAVAGALKGAEAQVNQGRTAIGSMVEGISASLRGKVQGVAGQIVGLINSIPIPDLPVVARMRAAAENLLTRAADVVTGTLSSVLGLVNSALSAAMGLLSSLISLFAKTVNGALSVVSTTIQRVMGGIFLALNRVANVVLSSLRKVLTTVILPAINRLEGSILLALAKARRQTIDAICKNRDEHLEALVAAIRRGPGGGKGGGAGATAAGSLKDIAREAVRNNRTIVQAFEERTSTTLGLIFGAVGGSVERILGQVTSSVARVVQAVVEKVVEAVQRLIQLEQAVAGYIQSVIQALSGALGGIIEWVISLIKSPVDQFLSFVGRAVSRAREFISRFIRNLIGGGSLSASLTEVVGGSPPILSGPITKPRPGPITLPTLEKILIVLAVVGALVVYLFPELVVVVSALVALGLSPLAAYVVVGMLAIVAVLLLLLLLYLLYKWLTRPAPPLPPGPPKGTEYDPGTPFKESYSVPLVKADIQASAGEKMIFGVQATDEDRSRPIGTTAWATFKGTGPYEIVYEVSGEADFLSAGSGIKRHVDPKLDSFNVFLFISSTWSKSRIAVKATVTDKAGPAAPPDIGTTKDPDHVITWTIIDRKNPCPTSLKRVAGPGSVFVSAPAVYQYQGQPTLPPGVPSYQDQTVLESFANTKAVFTMADLKASWKAAHPTLNTPDKVANYLYGVSRNGTFVFDHNDRIADQHAGFGDVTPFEPAALKAPTGVGFSKEQTYSCSTAAIGSALIERRYTTARGIEVRKTGP